MSAGPEREEEREMAEKAREIENKIKKSEWCARLETLLRQFLWK